MISESELPLRTETSYGSLLRKGWIVCPVPECAAFIQKNKKCTFCERRNRKYRSVEQILHDVYDRYRSQSLHTD